MHIYNTEWILSETYYGAWWVICTKHIVAYHNTMLCTRGRVRSHACGMAEGWRPTRTKWRAIWRKDLAQHMIESLSDHVTALFEDHMKLKHENAQLKRELNQLKPKKK